MRAISTGCLAALLAIGCQSTPPQQQHIEPMYDRESGRLRELSYDADHDGRAEMKAVMDGSDLRKVEIDENGDGQADRWEYYDSGLGTRGSGLERNVVDEPVLVRVERATRRDGRVTRTEGFARGALAWAEEDRDANGRIDRWEKYVDGALSTLALDTRGSGTPNRLLTYTGDNVQIIEK